MRTGYGLIGYPLSHSASEKYFTEKFEKEKISDCNYRLFPIKDIADFHALLKLHPNLAGLNVTIPYKKIVIPLLDEIDNKAGEIGAVNTISISRKDGKIFTKGFNTDADGFLLSANFNGYNSAVILGTGGAGHAVEYTFRSIGIPVCFVSRTVRDSRTIGYQELDLSHFARPLIIVNATPLGMYPDNRSFPEIPYQDLVKGDFLYDLVYNPDKTIFLSKGEEMGTKTQNGWQMLKNQAELSYKMWTEDNT